MSKVYFPVENINDFSCYSIVDSNTIRAYKTTPIINGQSDYVDYYIHSDYISRPGVQSWSGYYATLPVCLDTVNVTNDFYYRADIFNVLIIFLILSIFIVFIPYKIISRIFGRWLKI